MTKNAQQALKYLLQSSCYNVRFCLICNYISKIDESLKNEFICIRFNQLPQTDIYKFIKNITISENLNLSDDVIDSIQNNFNSDIRSMINFIQLNQNVTIWETNIISNKIWETIYDLLSSPNNNNGEIINYIHGISIQYNIDKKNIMKNYFNYIIRNKKSVITRELLTIIENIMHTTDTNIGHLLEYFIHTMKICL